MARLNQQKKKPESKQNPTNIKNRYFVYINKEVVLSKNFDNFLILFVKFCDIFIQFKCLDFYVKVNPAIIQVFQCKTIK